MNSTDTTEDTSRNEPDETSTTNTNEEEACQVMRQPRAAHNNRNYGIESQLPQSLVPVLSQRAQMYLSKGWTHTTTGEEMQTPQMFVDKGLKVFGDKGQDAVKKELQQFHDQQVRKALKPDQIDNQKHKMALEYNMYLNQKHCRKIKARGHADSRPQQVYITKEEVRSPTVMLESLLLSCVIDAKEGCNVAMVDILGAFMQVDIDNETYIRLKGDMASIMATIDPEAYKKCVFYEKGKPVLYFKLLKALHGTMKAAKLFWKRLTTSLQKWGFKLNPYDKCVANKMINGKQYTILWHVGDLKISHVDSTVVDNIIALLNDEYGTLQEISENCGKIHDYLGMTLDYSILCEVQVSMFDYIRNLLDNLPLEWLKGDAPSAAPLNLFKVNKTNPIKLDRVVSDTFHSLVAKLLFLMQWAQPDLDMAVSFLCT